MLEIRNYFKNALSIRGASTCGLPRIMLNTETGEIIPFVKINGSISPYPWNDLIIAEGKILSKSLLEMMQKRLDLDKARGRRNPWLGEGFLEYNP